MDPEIRERVRLSRNHIAAGTMTSRRWLPIYAEVFGTSRR